MNANTYSNKQIIHHRWDQAEVSQLLDSQSWMSSCATFVNTVVQLGILKHEFGKEFVKDFY